MGGAYRRGTKTSSGSPQNQMLSHTNRPRKTLTENCDTTHRSPRPLRAASVSLDTDAECRPELPAWSHDSEPTAAGERARRCRHRLKRHVIRVLRRKHLGVAVPHE